MADLESLIEKVTNLRDDNLNFYIKKYTKEWILHAIEEREEIKMIQQRFKDHERRGVDIIDFVRIFLNIIEHTETETLYIVIGLIDFFRDICESYGLTTHVRCPDIINYIVDSFLYASPSTNHTIPTRKLPPKKHFGSPDNRIREIDIKAPMIYGDSFGSIKRLSKAKLVTDRAHHLNSAIKTACYASEVKKVFALDSLADNISVYNIDCILEKRIHPKALVNMKDTMILDFDWSNKQLRLGACLKDHTLVFWDAGDNFEFEKGFSAAIYINEYQSKIWYIEFSNLWVTTDKTNQLHAWDISQESLLYSLKSDKIKSDIIDVIPIEVLKLVGVSSMDEMITIWDFSRRIIVIHIPMPNAGIHSFTYSKTFQTLITAGFENTISLWNIHPVYFDYTKIGRLIGHSSMVTAVEVIEKTPMIISADDIGNIKVWDIRNMSCLQTIEMGGRTIINKLIDMYDVARLCFVGSRVNILNFDDAYDIKNKLESAELQWPIQVEYNFSMNEVVVCTKKDVRFLDASTGRLKKVYAGLLSNTEDDITAFRMAQQNKKFILGDQRGNLGLYLHQTGELLQSMQGHTNEVSSIKIDYVNKLIISSSWDSSVVIQKELKNKFTETRKITNCHFRKEISVMETSVYHNLIVTGAARSNILYLYDYEYIRLIGSIEIEDDAEATSVQFINGYSILLVSTNIGTVHFFHFMKKDISYIEIKHLAFIDVDKYLAQKHKTAKKHDANYNGVAVVTKLLLDVGYDSDGTTKPEEAYLYIALSKGMVLKYHIEGIFANQEITLIPHANSRSNYNAERITTENFEEAVKNYKIYSFNIRKNVGTYQNIQGISSKGIIFGAKNTVMNLAVSPQSSVVKSELPRRGIILSPLNIKEKPASSGDKSDSEFSEYEYADSVVNLSQAALLSFQAHKDILTTLSFIVCPEKKLLTSSLDHYFRIWDLDGSLLASVNINHPLPIAWNLETNSAKQAQKRVLHGMKIIETIFKRYDGKITGLEEKKININHFLAQIDRNGSRETANEQQSLAEKRPEKLILMSDEYEPKDIQFDKIKGIYQREIQGPTLRQMEISKRLMLAHKEWKKNESSAFEGMNTDKAKNKEDLENFNNELMGYLLGDQKETLNILLNQTDQAVKTKQLKKKLAVSIKKPQDTNLMASPRTGQYMKKNAENFNLLHIRLDSKEDMHTDDSYLISPPKKEPRKAKEIQPQPIEEYKAPLHSKRSHSHVDNPSSFLFSKDAEQTKIEDLSTIQTTARRTTEREEENSVLKSGKKTPMQNTSISEKKKSLPPILNFYQYANQKHLLSPDARSVRSQISTDPGTPGSLSQRDRKGELQVILSTLDRRLKKSQNQEQDITFKTIVDESKRKKEEDVKKKQLKLTKMKSRTDTNDLLTSKEKKSLPSINFNENLENFRKNMEQMIQGMMEGAKESVSDKVARMIDEKLRQQARIDPDFDYELLQSEGKKPDFVPLGEIFRKIEAIGAVNDDVIYKKSLHSPQTQAQNIAKLAKASPSRKESDDKRSHGEKELEQVRNKTKFEKFHQHTQSADRIGESRTIEPSDY